MRQKIGVWRVRDGKLVIGFFRMIKKDGDTLV